MHCLMVGLQLADMIKEGEALSLKAPLTEAPTPLKVAPHNRKILNAQTKLIRGLDIQRLYLNACGELKGLPDHYR